MLLGISFSTLQLTLDGFANELGPAVLADQRVYPIGEVRREPHEDRLHVQGWPAQTFSPVSDIAY